DRLPPAERAQQGAGVQRFSDLRLDGDQLVLLRRAAGEFRLGDGDRGGFPGDLDGSGPADLGHAATADPDGVKARWADGGPRREPSDVLHKPWQRQAFPPLRCGGVFGYIRATCSRTGPHGPVRRRPGRGFCPACSIKPGFRPMTALWLIVLCGVLAIVYAVWAIQSVLAADAGTARMQEISAAVREGAQAYLKRQYTTIGIVGIVIFFIIGYFLGWLVAAGFLIG